MKRSINIGKMIVFPYESYSNYINLPARCLERLSNLHMSNTYFFELKSESKELVYVGVKEFISTDDCVEVPCWLSEHLQTDYANITLIKNIPKGEYIKIEPQEEEFFSLPDNDKLVEYELSKYCLLQLNQIIPMQIFDKVYKFKIIEIKDHDLIDIVNIDLNVDFNNKFFKEEKIYYPQEEFNYPQEEFNYQDLIQEPTQDVVHDTEQIFNELKPENIPVEPIVLPDRDKLREARLKFYTKKEEVIQVSEPAQKSSQELAKEPEPVPEEKVKASELPKAPEQPLEKLEEPIPPIKIKRKYTKKKKFDLNIH
jgi:hypothetical protein